MAGKEDDDLIIEQIKDEVEPDPLDLEVVDDTPEGDKGRPRRPDGAEPEIPSDDEIKDYSKKVKERISKLKYEFHEERRQKEEALRLREEAVQYAKQVREDAERMRKIVADGEKFVVGEAKGRLLAELDNAKRLYKEAFESGEADKLAEAAVKIADLQSNLGRVSSYNPPEQKPTPEFNPRPQVEQQWAERDRKWLAENDEWFKKDKKMTGYAMGLHEEILEKGVAVGSEEYYRQIDAEMRKQFPTLAGAASNRQPVGTVVAPTDRNTVANPRKVRLTETQVNLAKQLGLTPEQYARELLKLQGQKP